MGQCIDSILKNYKGSFASLFFRFEAKGKYVKYCLFCSRSKESSVTVVILVILKLSYIQKDNFNTQVGINSVFQILISMFSKYIQNATICFFLICFHTGPSSIISLLRYHNRFLMPSFYIVSGAARLVLTKCKNTPMDSYLTQ